MSDDAPRIGPKVTTRVTVGLALVAFHCAICLLFCVRLKQQGWFPEEDLGSLWARMALGPLSMYKGPPTGPSGTALEGAVIGVCCLAGLGSYLRFPRLLTLGLLALSYVVWAMCGFSSVAGGFY